MHSIRPTSQRGCPRTLAGMALPTAVILSHSVLAGAFDGNWIGQIPPSGQCHAVATMTITVSGTTLTGIVHNVGNVRPFTGTVDADGNATFAVPEFHYGGTIKFTPDHFDANWNSGNCQRHSLGDRAPDAAQTASLISLRRESQSLYDELSAKAAAGERSVDFTALRASYPFTKQWDVFGKTTGPILEQAEVAAKGKDCATALEKLDEVLRIDYTIIAAHRARSECLKGSAAHVESRIADGLMDSLTRDHNGDSENTAYPVMTRHEETDILRDKHIIFKTRDIEVRGSNGRFYDVVHGVSVSNGIRIKDVYFDVTTEVNGRNSAMAAAP